MQAQADKTHFSEWCILELFGHQKMAGHVTQAPIGDFLRVDVYGPNDSEPVFTRMISPKAIYALNPCEEKVARLAAKQFQPQPISKWRMKQLLPPEPEADTFAADDDLAF